MIYPRMDVRLLTAWLIVVLLLAQIAHSSQTATKAAIGMREELARERAARQRAERELAIVTPFAIYVSDKDYDRMRARLREAAAALNADKERARRK